MGVVVDDSKIAAEAINCTDEVLLLFKNAGMDGNVVDDLEFCYVVEQ